jgi:hypothetical protein
VQSKQNASRKAAGFESPSAPAWQTLCPNNR